MFAIFTGKYQVICLSCDMIESITLDLGDTTLYVKVKGNDDLHEIEFESFELALKNLRSNLIARPIISGPETS